VIDQVANAWDGLDAFVQCAGVGLTVGPAAGQVHHTMEQVDEQAWDWMQQVHAKCAFFAARRVATHLRRGAGGNIVLIGSVDGVKPVPAPVHYAAAKGALAGMTAAMAKELGPHGVCVNLVAPGILEEGACRVLCRRSCAQNTSIAACAATGVWLKSPPAGWLALHNTYVTGQNHPRDGPLASTWSLPQTGAGGSPPLDGRLAATGFYAAYVLQVVPAGKAGTRSGPVSSDVCSSARAGWDARRHGTPWACSGFCPVSSSGSSI
jgi:hypothetical protein